MPLNITLGIQRLKDMPVGQHLLLGRLTDGREVIIARAVDYRVILSIGDIPYESIPFLGEEQQEEVQGSAAEPGPEGPLQACDCQTPPVEGSIGGPGPLPDAFPDEVPEVEGVGSDAKGEPAHQRSMRDGAIGGYIDRPFRGSSKEPHYRPEESARDPYSIAQEVLRRVWFDDVEPESPLGGMTPAMVELMSRPPHPGIAAWASLDKLVADAIAGGATTGTLAVTSGDFRASASWKDGVVESAYMSKTRPDREA